MRESEMGSEWAAISPELDTRNCKSTLCCFQNDRRGLANGKLAMP